MKMIKRILVFVMCSVLAISSCLLVNGADYAEDFTNSTEDDVENVDSFALEDIDDDGGFFSYFSKYSGVNFPDTEMALDIATLENASYIEKDGRKAFLMSEGDSASFSLVMLSS